MTVLDAQALLGYLRHEPAAPLVARLLREGSTISAVNVAEVLDVLTRVFGADADEVSADIGLLQLGGLAVSPPDAQTAFAAGRIRASQYHRTRRPISLADAFAAATARALSASLATTDAALADAVLADGGEVIDLPDSAGRRTTRG